MREQTELVQLICLRNLFNLEVMNGSLNNIYIFAIEMLYIFPAPL